MEVRLVTLCASLAIAAGSSPGYVTLNDGKEFPAISLGTCCGSDPAVGKEAREGHGRDTRKKNQKKSSLHVAGLQGTGCRSQAGERELRHRPALLLQNRVSRRLAFTWFIHVVCALVTTPGAMVTRLLPLGFAGQLHI